jgi:hypothetical protein
MASKAKPIKVYESGGLYMIARGNVARLVSEAEGVGPAGSFGVMLRHVHVVEPWQFIAEFEQLPEIVKEAIESA